jgi:predicted NUDIX family phosphoesterase
MASVENILVIPRSLFDQLGAFQGLSFDPDRYRPALLDPARNLFLPRPEAENDPSYKQLIPYLIVHHADRVLCYTRGQSGGEARLHAKMSIGIGGHINDGDTHAAHFDEASYFRAVERELHEELDIPGGYRQRIAALLNDDSNDVGRVHLGIVHLIEVASTEVRPREEAIARPQFLTASELAPHRDRLESWSQICFDGLGGLLPNPAP